MYEINKPITGDICPKCGSYLDVDTSHGPLAHYFAFEPLRCPHCRYHLEVCWQSRLGFVLILLSAYALTAEAYSMIRNQAFMLWPLMLGVAGMVGSVTYFATARNHDLFQPWGSSALVRHAINVTGVVSLWLLPVLAVFVFFYL